MITTFETFFDHSLTRCFKQNNNILDNLDWKEFYGFDLSCLKNKNYYVQAKQNKTYTVTFIIRANIEKVHLQYWFMMRGCVNIIFRQNKTEKVLAE